MTSAGGQAGGGDLDEAGWQALRERVRAAREALGDPVVHPDQGTLFEAGGEAGGGAEA